ncbi:MAG: hypothetical protein A3C38_05285 [Planctomycetes bacterium RIFCSPHIGHO2_02_FULL_50_42]|nr:MAG: hypothetical protein A3C38_05285 [Planctomycetes bacterium RIFCSPHIGHO2_02_FULL_50_42]
MCFLLLSPTGAQEQPSPPGGPSPEVIEELKKAKAEIEEARRQTEAATASLKTSVLELETRLQKIEEESVQAMGAKEAQADTMINAVELAQTAQLESVSKEGVKVLSEELQILKDIIRTQEELLKTREDRVALLERKMGLAQEVETASIEKAATAQKEVEIAEAYLQAANSKLKEKEASLEKSQKKFAEVQEKVELGKRVLEKESETLAKLPLQKEETSQRFVRNLKLLNKRRLSNLSDEAATAEKDVQLAQTELEKTEVDVSNARHKVALLQERTLLLEERLKAERLRKMDEEAELARKAEEERKRKAEEEKAAIRREREKALREGEALAKKQQAVVSSEQKRVLELEFSLLALREQIAKKKEALITEETRASEYATEFRKLDRWKNKLTAINSLAEATYKEKALLTEQLQEAQAELTALPGEIPKVVKEAQTFQDKAMADKLMAHANERVKLLEENLRLIDELTSEIEKERNIILNDGLELLADAVKKLNEIKVSNLWIRRQWTDSWLNMKNGLTKLSLPGRTSDLITTAEKSAEEKQHLPLTIAGVLAIIAATVLGSYYCRRWCRINLKKLEDAGRQNGS